jgi:hypothetical protein
VLAKNLTEDRRLLARRSACIISIGGLEIHTGYELKTAIPSTPNHKGGQRASTAYNHRGGGRRTLGTSKDVMPAIAGYTSLPPVTTTIVKIGSCHEDMV